MKKMKNRKRIYLIDEEYNIIKEYSSLKAAADANKLNVGSLQRVAFQNTHFTTGDKRFVYVNLYDKKKAEFENNEL